MQTKIILKCTKRDIIEATFLKDMLLLWKLVFAKRSFEDTQEQESLKELSKNLPLLKKTCGFCGNPFLQKGHLKMHRRNIIESTVFKYLFLLWKLFFVKSLSENLHQKISLKYQTGCTFMIFLHYEFPYALSNHLSDRRHFRISCIFYFSSL